MAAAVAAEAVALYEALPRGQREGLYLRIMANPQFPFHDGPHDSAEGYIFFIATGDHGHPIADATLDLILEGLADNQDYNAEQTQTMYQVYRTELLAMQAGAPMPVHVPGPIPAHIPAPVPAAISVAAAPHLGDLVAIRTGSANEPMLRIHTDEIGALNSILYEPFQDGEEVVVLERSTYGFKHVFKRASIETWLTHQTTSPTTRKHLVPADIERYTIRIQTVGGSRNNNRRKNSRSRRNRKIKNSRNRKSTRSRR